ncbi:hypothetical protein SAMN05216436_1311 [bacterium A37T11]|nr:hypothetical protein SAMN05216436_1311 [bacterium A37T11]
MHRKVPKEEKNDADHPERAESQQYDKVFRQKMPFILPGILEKVFGLHIVEFIELKDKLQTTK